MTVSSFKRSLPFIIITSLVAGTAWADTNPMVGDWKLNPKKSKLTDVMKVSSLGPNKYSFDFGSGEPEIAVADGTEQPGHFGITITVTADRPDRWTVVRKKNGEVLVTGIWTLSNDGSHLTDHFIAKRRNGDSSTLDYVYERQGGGSGFVGTWVSVREQVNSDVLLKIRPWQGDGLSFISQGGAGTKNVKFDGKDYPNVGAVVDGMTASARRISVQAVEVTDKISGKLRDEVEIAVFPDGNVLTMTIHIPGRTEPDVQVFERQ